MVDPGQLTRAILSKDAEAIGGLLLEMAGASLGNYVRAGSLIDKLDRDDLKQELAMRAWAALPTLRNPDRAFTFVCRLMSRRRNQLVGRARRKCQHALRFCDEIRARGTVHAGVHGV